MGRKKVNSDKKSIGLDDLCDLVNDKYNLKPNQIGSIEFHNDMSESSIVQICNQYRGVRQLMYGSEPVLKKYLRNILDNKVILNFWDIK